MSWLRLHMRTCLYLLQRSSSEILQISLCMQSLLLVQCAIYYYILSFSFYSYLSFISSIFSNILMKPRRTDQSPEAFLISFKIESCFIQSRLFFITKALNLLLDYITFLIIFLILDFQVQFSIFTHSQETTKDLFYMSFYLSHYDKCSFFVVFIIRFLTYILILQYLTICSMRLNDQLQSQLNHTMQSNEEPLIKKPSNHPQRPVRSYFANLRDYLFPNIQTTNRTISLAGSVEPLNYQKNIVKNTKYNIITFVPVVLYNQFKFFLNLFFLCTALTQLVPVLKVGLIITYLGPLALVLTLTMVKQAVDDYKRYARDMEANSKIYKVLRQDGFVDLKSMELSIGDIIQINGNDRIPADMILLYSEDPQGTVFLKTDQLDGETDWKLRKAVKRTQSFVKNSNSQTVLVTDRFSCEATPPADKIYVFQGIFSQKSQFNSETKKQRLTLQNTLWTSTVLANGRVLGLVTYCGKETRIALGASEPRPKVGILDWQINTLSKILFGVLFSLTLVQVILQAPDFYYVPIQFIRILILLSSIIPISMRVNLDFAKLVYSWKINQDQQIKGTLARNSNIPQQLGRIKYLLTDKTGTLTQNQMIFKRLSLQEESRYSNEQIQQLKEIVKVYTKAPLNLTQKKIKKKSQVVVKELITALAICHNVTPIMQGSERTYQASSPDEITLVKMAQQMGILILQRTQNTMKLQNAQGQQQQYDILYNFPFSSERKRMGILVLKKQTNQYIFYLKGADSVMKTFVNDLQKKGFIQEQCKDLASEGLRTLVISQKIISEQFVQDWKKRYEQGNTKLIGGKEIVQKCIGELQNNIQFLGITGVEDKLQENVKMTLQHLRNAEIKIWMLTGDKIQTAECIGISSGIVGITQKIFKIEDVQSTISLKNKFATLKAYQNQLQQRVLIIDGKSLAVALDGNKNIRKQFYQISMKLPSVLCCRCSPAQKAQIVAGIKQFNTQSNNRIAAIGDGGNDVGMIQAADVGLGIVGKQGKQAALAADYSMIKFKYIKKLFLWHGRLSYKRSALLAQFVIHRGLLISVMQIMFSCIFYFVSIPIFNSYLQLGYATLFTFWPVFSLIFDQDIDRKRALQYPKLYASLQQGQQLTVLTFIGWVWKATYQGSVILIFSIVFFSQSYIQLQTICFSVLILTEYCMSLSQLNRLHMVSIICVVCSLILYIFCVVFLNKVIDVSTLDMREIAFIGLIVAISWGPIFLQKVIKNIIAPSDYQKVMKNAKRGIGKNIIYSSFVEDEETYDES